MLRLYRCLKRRNVDSQDGLMVYENILEEDELGRARNALLLVLILHKRLFDIVRIGECDRHWSYITVAKWIAIVPY